VDYVQWTGSSSGGSTATYKYDPSGRRIEKDVDGDTTTYVYDGGNVIAEYDDNGDLASKYIHGARVDELVCMIDVADSNAVYYYHYDGLGSVVALSNSSGTSIQSYEYSAYGQVAASDPNFTANPYLFTGRRFDYETGLYYYRARYYNPYVGRFLQTDPVGYGDGINWYAYCGNNPVGRADPSGLYYGFGDPDNGRLTWAWFDDATGEMSVIKYYANIDAWCNAPVSERFLRKYGPRDSRGWALSRRYTGDKDWFYERLQFLALMNADGGILYHLDEVAKQKRVNIVENNIKFTFGYNGYIARNGIVNVYWKPDLENWWSGEHKWHTFPALAALAHELQHAYDITVAKVTPSEKAAMITENNVRYYFYQKVPQYAKIWPRPGYQGHHDDLGFGDFSVSRAWKKYWKINQYPIDDAPK
jgi:RHS repeat-associated protein